MSLRTPSSVPCDTKLEREKNCEAISRPYVFSGQVSAWHHTTLLSISCKSVPPVPARVEEPISPVRQSSSGCATINPSYQCIFRHRRRKRTTHQYFKKVAWPSQHSHVHLVAQGVSTCVVKELRCAFMAAARTKMFPNYRPFGITIPQNHHLCPMFSCVW